MTIILKCHPERSEGSHFLCYYLCMSISDLFKNKTDRIASTHLGKKSEGSNVYDPSLLVAVPRIENRKQYSIDENNLPFCGFDVWHAYEFSCMTENGVPVTRVLKLKYPCNSMNIVESKSLKLYLNSFNMQNFGSTIQECLEICSELIKSDLQKLLREVVEVKFLDNSAEKVQIFDKYVDIMSLVEESTLQVVAYKEAPEVLQTSLKSEKEQTYLRFDSLRSNCRVTHQPDFGDVFIYYNSEKKIDEASLVKYLVSFRSEYHFHEECCEMIYKRLSDILNAGDELFVCCLYTRRGGIDICPARWSNGVNVEDVKPLLDLSKLARSGIKQ